MASAMVDDDGVQAEPVRPLTLSDDQVLRSRDIHVIRMRKQGLTWRQIGLYFDLSDRGAKKRWDRIPPVARDYYARSAALA